MKFKCNPLTCDTCFGRIPQRVILAILLHLALQNSYNLRVVLNVAIVEMVEPEAATNITEVVCPDYVKEEKVREGFKFSWPPLTRTLVLYSFFMGYVISHVPGGWLADKFGGRYVLGICILLSSISTAIFPYFSRKGGYIVAVILRAILGIAQGPVLPAISSFVSTWIPPNERTLLGGISYGGSNLGTILGSIITGHLIGHFKGWAVAFYFWSSLSIIYITLHLFYAFSFPSTHPFISEEELEYLNKTIVSKRRLKTPWKAILTNIPYWANISAQFGHNYIFFTLNTFLPTYMKDILHFNIEENGTYSALPFVALWLSSLVLSFTGNYLVNTLNCMSSHTFSKIFGTMFARSSIAFFSQHSLGLSGFCAMKLSTFYKETFSIIAQNPDSLWRFLTLLRTILMYLSIKIYQLCYMIILANMGSAALALGAVYAGCNRELCIALYVLCMAVKSFYYMTLPVNINELSRNYGGIMFGICNGLSSISGILGNHLIGVITKNKKFSEWQNAFWITFAISVLTSIVYILWSSAERQPFDYDEDEEPPPPSQ